MYKNALGQTAPFARHRCMSIVPPIADMPVNGSFAPEAVIRKSDVMWRANYCIADDDCQRRGDQPSYIARWHATR